MYLNKIVAFAALLFAWGNLNAADYECIAYDDLRHISLDYPGRNHLCEVSVTKQGGKREVKWYANNDSRFCADKLAQLIDKYQNLWEFKCERWPDRIGLLELADRQRNLIDTLVKRVTKEGQTVDPPFMVTGARISSTELASNNNTALIAQLFLKAQSEQIEARGSRTFYIEDNGADFSTQTLEQIENNVTMLKPDFRVDAAIVSAIHPSGEIEVSTTVFAPEDNNKPRCFGTQLFAPGENGVLRAVSDHEYHCKG